MRVPFTVSCCLSSLLLSAFYTPACFSCCMSQNLNKLGERLFASDTRAKATREWRLAILISTIKQTLFRMVEPGWISFFCVLKSSTFLYTNIVHIQWNLIKLKFKIEIKVKFNNVTLSHFFLYIYSPHFTYDPCLINSNLINKFLRNFSSIYVKLEYFTEYARPEQIVFSVSAIHPVSVLRVEQLRLHFLTRQRNRNVRWIQFAELWSMHRDIVQSYCDLHVGSCIQRPDTSIQSIRTNQEHSLIYLFSQAEGNRDTR